MCLTIAEVSERAPPGGLFERDNGKMEWDVAGSGRLKKRSGVLA